MDDIQERLDRILDAERQSIEGRLRALDVTDAPSGVEESGGEGDGGDQCLGEVFRRLAERRSEQLDTLPPEVGGRIQGLRDYDFLDPEARQQFEDLLQMLQQQVREMVRDLSQLIQQRFLGEDPDIREFMKKWGPLFPDDIEDFDPLMDHIQRRMAQMQSLVDSMPPEMRDQLQDMIEALLQNAGLQWELSELAANMDQLNPDRFSEAPFPFSGDDSLTLQEALRPWAT